MARKPKKIRVEYPWGTKMAKGQRVGKTWAVTQSQTSDNYWEAIHMPTGLRALGPGPKGAVTAFARRMVELGMEVHETDKVAAASQLILMGGRDVTEQAERVVKGRGTRAQMADAMRKLSPRRGYPTVGAEPVESDAQTRARLRKEYGTPEAGYPYVHENAIAKIAAEVDLHQLKGKKKAVGLRRMTKREIELLDNLDAAVVTLQEKVDVWFTEMEEVWGPELVHPVRVQLESDLEAPRLARARGLWDGQGLLPGIPPPRRG